MCASLNNVKMSHLSEQDCSESGVWTSGGETWVVQASLNSVRQRKLDLAVQELAEILRPHFRGRNNLNLHDLNGTWSGSMTCTHIAIALCHSAGCCQVAVFTVHVVRATARVVTQPDTEVLNRGRPLLIYLLTEKYFTLGFLYFPQHRCKVPVARLCLRTIWSEDPHLVDGRHSHLTGRHHPTNNLVLLQISTRPHGVFLYRKRK